MTKGDVALRLYDLVSQASTVAPNAAVVRGVLECCNAAVQEISHYATRDFWKDTQSAILYPPTTVTLDVTENSKTIASLSTWASWMEGCSIEIAGSDQLHRLNSETTLQEEWIGSTGSGVSATIYGDAVKLNGTVLKLLGSVVLNDERVLTPLVNEDLNNRMHHNRDNFSGGDGGNTARIPTLLCPLATRPGLQPITSSTLSMMIQPLFLLRRTSSG